MIVVGVLADFILNFLHFSITELTITDLDDTFMNTLITRANPVTRQWDLCSLRRPKSIKKGKFKVTLNFANRHLHRQFRSSAFRLNKQEAAKTTFKWLFRNSPPEVTEAIAKNSGRAVLALTGTGAVMTGGCLYYAWKGYDFTKNEAKRLELQRLAENKRIQLKIEGQEKYTKKVNQDAQGYKNEATGELAQRGTTFANNADKEAKVSGLALKYSDRDGNHEASKILIQSRNDSVATRQGIADTDQELKPSISEWIRPDWFTPAKPKPGKGASSSVDPVTASAPKPDQNGFPGLDQLEDWLGSLYVNIYFLMNMIRFTVAFLLCMRALYENNVHFQVHVNNAVAWIKNKKTLFFFVTLNPSALETPQTVRSAFDALNIKFINPAANELIRRHIENGIIKNQWELSRAVEAATTADQLVANALQRMADAHATFSINNLEYFVLQNFSAREDVLGETLYYTNLMISKQNFPLDVPYTIGECISALPYLCERYPVFIGGIIGELLILSWVLYTQVLYPKSKKG